LTQRFNAYLLMRSVVQTLQDSGAAVELQQAALSDWLTLGFKNEIEQALADVIRLAAKSSVVDAMSCRAQLDETMLLSAGDVSYAPTSFYPLSAALVGSWTLAEVSLDELSSCAARTFPDSPVSFRSSSAAQCKFAFTVIDTVRPWPFAQLLSRDDWKVSGGDPASLGDGVRGTVPAYVQTLYAATVIGMSSTPSHQAPSGGPTHEPEPRLPGHLVRTPIRMPILRGPEKSSRVVLGRGNIEGVLSDRLSVSERSHLVSHGVVLRPRDMALVRRFQIPLDRSQWLERLANFQLDRPVLQEDTPIDLASGAHVVGFGCVVVPASPQPNEQYQW
jgi:hypothetical protein